MRPGGLPEQSSHKPLCGHQIIVTHDRTMSEPTKNDPKLQEMLHRNKIEHASIINNIGLVTRAWGTLEMTLCDAFRHLGAFPETERWAAGVIFYTPSNTETRVSLVDKLIAYRFQPNIIPEFDPRICSSWASIKGKIDALKNTRNAIVHGVVTHSAKGVSPYDQTPRLTPAPADWLRFSPAVLAGRHPGLGSNEIKVHEQAVWRVNARAHKLSEVIQLRLRQPFLPESGGVNPKLSALLIQLENLTSSQNSQDQELQDKSGHDQSSHE
jgi:hypothetical protein